MTNALVAWPINSWRNCMASTWVIREEDRLCGWAESVVFLPLISV